MNCLRISKHLNWYLHDVCCPYIITQRVHCSIHICRHNSACVELSTTPCIVYRLVSRWSFDYLLFFVCFFFPSRVTVLFCLYFILFFCLLYFSFCCCCFISSIFFFHFSVGINEQLRRGARPFFALENNWKKPLAVCLFAPISSTTHPQSKRERNNRE